MQRRYDLDWLRVLAILALHVFHCGMAFNTWGWHIKNEPLTASLDFPMAFMSTWRMPLLFLISGIGTIFALGSRQIHGFVVERHRRLLFPLAVGMLFVIPPQVYYERLFQGQTYSFSTFYSSLFSGVPYPEGNLSWHHLWFVAYLFVYALLSLPLLAWLKKPNNVRLTRIRAFFSVGSRIYWLFLPIALVNLSLRAYWPTRNDLIHDWANFCFHLVLFWMGLFIGTFPGIWDRIVLLRRRSLELGLITLLILMIDDLLGVDGGYIYPVEQSLRSGLTLFWVLAILGYGRQYLSFSNRFLRYANEGIYPFYILHQTVIVIMGYYVIQWPLTLWPKFLILTILSFSGTVALYEVLIRRCNFIRPLFGLKLRQTPPTESRSVSVETQLKEAI
ncbi:MAG: acyltransferase family protein [Acidobacteria bacterium]|nr:acyltransferase family protein [Acidobacteriota bacterium]MCB9398649.1 acyltransferase family protein [Acidobacteriota bacterium]